MTGTAHVDVLPSMNAGDSYRVAIEPQSPRRVPASSRLPRGFRAWFLLQIPTIGNFTVTNQPHIPLGLTDSPQADTARPAAKEDFNTNSSLYPRPEGLGFTEHSDKIHTFYRSSLTRTSLWQATLSVNGSPSQPLVNPTVPHWAASLTVVRQAWRFQKPISSMTLTVAVQAPPVS